MFMSQNITAQEITFAAVPMTEVKDAAKPAPTEGPYDWAADVYGADSFVFRADMTQDVCAAQFA